MKITLTSDEAARIVAQDFKMRGRHIEVVTIEHPTITQTPQNFPLMAVFNKAENAERNTQGKIDAIKYIRQVANAANSYISIAEAKAFIEVIWKLADKAS